ncbi:RNA exonuclease 4 isoform X2 [Dendrobium catenatum]|uniref:RNA exonuclease 4 isoform X2 n=1 Tax=Dendrobium catenatum TaxID=906689 RepID=UPI0010A0131C|nr:RNA exonuclease 4 isoform X2 [Dendrobium catenatum]
MAKEGYGTAGGKAAAAAAACNPNWASLQEKLKGRKPLVSLASLDNGTRATSALGKRKERPDTVPAAPLSTPSILAPTSEDFSLTEALAMDCEMVGVSFQGNKSALGRVSLVNTWGNVVYDEYVRPIEYVVDFRTKISGIRPRNLMKAKEFSTVQKKVAEAIKGRILVGHALHNDLKVLLLSHPRKDTRDTAEYQPFLSWNLLGKDARGLLEILLLRFLEPKFSKRSTALLRMPGQQCSSTRNIKKNGKKTS